MLEKPLILFDGECNPCNWAVNFVLHREGREMVLFCPDQSDSGRKIPSELGLTKREMETAYLLKNDKVYSQSTAVLRFVGKLLVAFIIVPKCIRDGIYDVIARNR